MNNIEFSILVAEGGDTLATHGRVGSMRGRRQQSEILVTRPVTAIKKQGEYSSITFLLRRIRQHYINLIKIRFSCVNCF